MKPFNKVVLHQNATIKDALQIIDDGNMRIAFIINKDYKLIGTISDGDIRRAFLNGKKIDDKIEDIINTNFLYAKVGDSKEKILNIAKSKNIYQIPIIDEQHILKGVEEVGDLLKHSTKNNKVVLMVGGLGTRLRPLTDEIPKPLLKVGNKPILETIIEGFANYGFKNFILSVNYKSEMIESYFGTGEQHGVNIEYIYEDKRMGTAGALSLMKNRLIDDFFVMNGDLLTNINYEHLLDYHEKTNSDATMCVRQYDFKIPYGVVNIDGDNIVSIDEKPIQKFFVNAGIYMFSKNVLDYIPEGEFYDMPSLFESLINNKLHTCSFPIREYWLDIGEMEEYRKANTEYLDVFRKS